MVSLGGRLLPCSRRRERAEILADFPSPRSLDFLRSVRTTMCDDPVADP